MTVRFIPELAGIVPYQPGLPIEVVQRRFGLEQVVKLASNEFPLPPFPEVKAVVMAALDRLQRYPDGFSTDLREALAAHYDREPRADHRRLRHVRAALPARPRRAGARRRGRARRRRRSRRTATSSPSAARSPWPCRCVDFTHDLEAMAAAVTPRTKMIFVCNPNNPTGTYVPVGRGRAAGRARARRRAGRHRRGVHRVRDGGGPRGLAAPSRRSTTTSSSCARSPRSTASAACARATGSARPEVKAGRRQGAAAVQREPARRSSPRIEALKHQDQVARAPGDQRAAARPHGGAARGARPRHRPHAGELHARRHERPRATRTTRSAARCSRWAPSCATATRWAAPAGRG